jgi:hypothetical protein
MSDNSLSTTAERGVCVHEPGGVDCIGGRLIFSCHPGWVLQPGTGGPVFADSKDAGIYTTGQLQCISVIVAELNSATWDGATLVHISHARHSLVDRLTITRNSYVAIGARGSVLNGMKVLRKRLLDTFDGLVDDRIWIYAGARDESPDFGMSNKGFIGETKQWVSASPSKPRLASHRKS